MKILIVDDNELQSKVISHFLKSNGYTTVIARNGYEALEFIDKLKFDLVISDVMMPAISGLDLVNLLNHFYFNNVPVILISASQNPDLALQAVFSGAVDFIVKPIDYEELLQRVKKYSTNH